MSVITETKGRVKLQHLEDLWDESVAAGMDEPELLRYRSNLLGADLRITNFAGGNTSSKVRMADPLTGQQTDVLWVKGSGGDLGSIRRAGFATLYMDKLLALEKLYRGVDREDEMVEYYPLCTFGLNPVAASIDTPLHGFLPFRHVDHLHPDCAIAVAAAANGIEKMEEFNRSHGHKLVWVPWQRPGFELAMMLKRAVEEQPDCDGIILGGHGLFTWGDTPRECYVNTISIIDELTSFVEKHQQKKGSGIFGGQQHIPLGNKKRCCGRDSSISARPCLLTEAPDRQLLGPARGVGVRKFARCRAAGVPRHQLPGSLHPHEDPPDVCALESDKRHRRVEEGDR